MEGPGAECSLALGCASPHYPAHISALSPSQQNVAGPPQCLREGGGEGHHLWMHNRVSGTPLPHQKKSSFLCELTPFPLWIGDLSGEMGTRTQGSEWQDFFCLQSKFFLPNP